MKKSQHRLNRGFIVARILTLSTLTILNQSVALSASPEPDLLISQNILALDETQNIHKPNFIFEADRFADIRILRYQVPAFDSFSLQQKQLLYFLTQAGMAGRDIMWDQNYKYNLLIRRTIEAIVNYYPGDRESTQFTHFMTYAKQVWFANGIHHHYSNDKFIPAFSKEFFAKLIHESEVSANFPLQKLQTKSALITFLTPILFDPKVAPKKVNTAPGIDKIAGSAVNFYEGLTELEVLAFYADKIDSAELTPISYGLNSKLTKLPNGQIVEQVWKIDGMYGPAIEQMVYWLEQAILVAETNPQRTALELLVNYYQSGDLADFDAYNIAWVADTNSPIDLIHGFIEVYNDPLGYRGSFEAVVSIRDESATKRIAALADYAQWFEDNSPINEQHKKTNVVGITGKAITVVAEAGDSSPSTPTGINLPNSSWIRANYGSKSVSLSNITAAYNAIEGGALEEFAYSQAEIERARTYGEIGGYLSTEMHEVIGHASGQINPGVGTTKETLKQYASAMEEGRADLVSLYYLMDPKLVEIGIMPSLEVGRARYDSYIRNGLLTQLYRIKPGNLIEEAHMRNRAEIAHWVYTQGRQDNVIERIVRKGKTYFIVNDYMKLRSLFGELLKEHQRIKSEGDFAAAQHLIETYGTQVDPALHAEVIERYATLDIAAYSGFINPRLMPVLETTSDGFNIIDVEVEYPTDFVSQMLEYANSYSFLPNEN